MSDCLLRYETSSVWSIARIVQAARGASGERDTWTLMLIAERRSRVWPGASPSFRKVNEPALLDAEIVHADAG
jgi:hypothetical protein